MAKPSELISPLNSEIDFFARRESTRRYLAFTADVRICALKWAGE